MLRATTAWRNSGEALLSRFAPAAEWPDALHWAKVRSPNEASPSATRGARSYAAELQTQPHDPVLVLVQPYENP
jgi:hypothetical protein